MLTISEDEVEHRARLGLRDGRKASVENRDRDRDRTLSLRSVRYEDSAYPSGKNQPVSDNFAAISEDWSDKQAEFDFQIVTDPDGSRLTHSAPYQRYP